MRALRISLSGLSPIYLTFILEYLEKNNINFELVKDKLRKIVYIPSYKEDLEEIKISKEDLEKLFHFLDYKIEDIFARVFLKIFAKVIFSILCSTCTKLQNA